MGQPIPALTVRKRRITGKNSIAAGDFQWIFARNCEVLNSYEML